MIQQLKQTIIFLITLITISCVNNKHSLTSDDLNDLNRFLNLSNSIIRMAGKRDVSLCTYNIFELGISISLPGDAIIMKRDGYYQEGICIELPEPFLFFQNKMSNDNEFLIGLNSYLKLRIKQITHSDNFLGEKLTNTQEIRNIIINELQKDSIYFEGIQNYNANYFFIFYDEIENYFYFTTINNISILLNISKTNDRADEIIINILQSITPLNKEMG